METKYKTTDKFTEEVISEILEVKEQNGLTAENLLEVAKNKNSALHDFFDWNDTSAGEKFRIYQARCLINEVKIVVDEKEFHAFENVNVSINEESSREYKGFVEILNTEQYRTQIIKQALESITSWKDKYKEYSEFKPIVSSIDKVKLKWAKKKK